MIAKPTTNQFIAEAQAKEISRQCGVAYVNQNLKGTLYRATVGKGEMIAGEKTIAKFENGNQVAL